MRLPSTQCALVYRGDVPEQFEQLDTQGQASDPLPGRKANLGDVPISVEIRVAGIAG